MATNPDNYLNNGRLNTAVFLLSLLAAALAAEFQVAVKRRRHRSVIANESAIVRVLLVEDDPTIGNAVQDHPRAKGWLVDWPMTLESATIAVAVEAHDVMPLAGWKWSRRSEAYGSERGSDAAGGHVGP